MDPNPKKPKVPNLNLTPPSSPQQDVTVPHSPQSPNYPRPDSPDQHLPEPHPPPSPPPNYPPAQLPPPPNYPPAQFPPLQQILGIEAEIESEDSWPEYAPSAGSLNNFPNQIGSSSSVNPAPAELANVSEDSKDEKASIDLNREAREASVESKNLIPDLNQPCSEADQTSGSACGIPPSK